MDINHGVVVNQVGSDGLDGDIHMYICSRSWQSKKHVSINGHLSYTFCRAFIHRFLPYVLTLKHITITVFVDKCFRDTNNVFVTTIQQDSTLHEHTQIRNNE